MKNIEELILCFGESKTITFKNGKYESFNLDDYEKCVIGDTAYNTIMTGTYADMDLPKLMGYRRDQIGEKVIIRLSDKPNNDRILSWFLSNLILKDKSRLLKYYKITSDDVYKIQTLINDSRSKCKSSAELLSDRKLILKWVNLISFIISNSELKYSWC